MNHPSDIPHQLIAKYLLGSITSQEEEALYRWVGLSDENTLLFDTFKRDWQMVHTGGEPVIPNKQEVWAKVLRRTGLHLRTKVAYSRRTMIKVASVAAIVAMLLGGAMSWFASEHVSPVKMAQIITRGGQRSQMLLPDGTKVWLNANTTLTYSSDFDGSNRNVQLDGEAYFNVTQSAEYPFVVQLGEVDVKVLGTKFNVKASSSSPTISVSLEEGRVSLQTPHANRLLTMLSPNQQAVITRSTLALNLSTCNARNESLWHLNQLLFDDMPAAEVWLKLEGWYGVRFKVHNMKKGTTYRFALKTESLSELLTMINQITPMDYIINGEEVVLTYK